MPSHSCIRPFSALPTELIVDIFRLAVDPESLPDDRGEEFYLPRLKEKSRTALVISHVSLQWRRVALGVPELWDGVYLNAEMCNREGIAEMLLDLHIDRQPNPLHIDVDCDWLNPPDSALAPNPDLADFTKIISKEMLLRCGSLRLRGSKPSIQSFASSLLGTLWRPGSCAVPLPLRQLQLDWVKPLGRFRDSPLIRIPCINQLSKLVSFRSNGLFNVPFHGWNVEEMVLSGGIQSFQNYIFWKNKLKRLVLRDQDVSFLRDLTVSHGTSAHLEYLELDSLSISPFCKVQSEPYAKFYAGIFISLGVGKTLRCLKLANLSKVGWDTFMAVLDKHQARFPLVERLILDNNAVGNGDSEATSFSLCEAFPNVEHLDLEGMGQVGEYLGELCETSRLELWPSVCEARFGDGFLWRRH
ncbi:hypothetical protein MD484_g8007, partial [Candolleomyces efflorescens]